MINNYGFDEAVVIGYSPRIVKAERTVSELERVGFSKIIVRSNFSNPFERCLFKVVKMGSREKYMNVSLGHYAVVKSSYEKGLGHVLVCEDDARFHKDVKRFADGIKNLPCDYDVAMLDSFPENSFSESEHEKLMKGRVNSNWCLSTVKRCSSACYALSRRGMERIVRICEKSTDGITPLRCFDQQFTPKDMQGLNFYVAFPNLAVQCETKLTSTIFSATKKIYDAEGINLDEYGKY